MAYRGNGPPRLKEPSANRARPARGPLATTLKGLGIALLLFALAGPWSGSVVLRHLDCLAALLALIRLHDHNLVALLCLGHFVTPARDARPANFGPFRQRAI